MYSPEQVPEKTIWTNYRAQQRTLADPGLTGVNSLLLENHGNENQENEVTAPYKNHSRSRRPVSKVFSSVLESVATLWMASYW
jgi:hypothetical protein